MPKKLRKGKEKKYQDEKWRHEVFNVHERIAFGLHSCLKNLDKVKRGYEDIRNEKPVWSFVDKEDGNRYYSTNYKYV